PKNRGLVSSVVPIQPPAVAPFNLNHHFLRTSCPWRAPETPRQNENFRRGQQTLVIYRITPFVARILTKTLALLTRGEKFGSKDHSLVDKSVVGKSHTLPTHHRLDC